MIELRAKRLHVPLGDTAPNREQDEGEYGAVNHQHGNAKADYTQCQAVSIGSEDIAYPDCLTSYRGVDDLQVARVQWQDKQADEHG
ncbi:hypothetical protein GCM10007863_05800 [Dyella mobilis]|nr:hypothetical protein GCM10007863_05800 [Dyella mobilis]